MHLEPTAQPASLNISIKRCSRTMATLFGDQNCNTFNLVPSGHASLSVSDCFAEDDTEMEGLFWQHAVRKHGIEKNFGHGQVFLNKMQTRKIELSQQQTAERPGRAIELRDSDVFLQ